MRIAVFLLGTLLALGAAIGAPRVAPRAEAGADRLLTTQYCEGGKVKVQFSWTGGNAASIEQWLDLSIFDNGWRDGTFIFVGPLVGSLTTFTWEGLTPATQHYVRVNQQLANRSWDPSPTFSVMTVGCSGSPAAAPGPTVGGVSVQLLGFSTSYSGGSPPPDLIQPGATQTACNPLNLYAFVRALSIPERTDFFVTWLVNSTPIPKAPITVLPGTNIFVVPFPLDTLTSVSARYTVRLTTVQNGPAVLEGGFTVAC
jgi:hypothetical protein